MLSMETPFGRLMSMGVGYQQLGRHQTLEEVLEGGNNACLDEGMALLKAGVFHDGFSLTLAPT